MKKLKYISRRTLTAVAILVFLLFSLSCSCYAEQPRQILLSIQQYENLLSLVQEQDNQLMMLEKKTEMLKLKSPELVKKLTECQSELSQAKQMLKESQENLTNSQQSLDNAEKEIFALKLSLSKLEEEIKNERARVKRKSTQKAFYGVLGGFLIGYAAAK